MTLREKLMHYTHDLGCGVDLKQEAIATIEHIAQYTGEDELLHHSRPLAIAYLALTEDASVPVVHGRWKMRPTGMVTDTGPEYKAYCTVCNEPNKQYQPPFCPHCGAKMDGGDSDAKSV